MRPTDDTLNLIYEKTTVIGLGRASWIRTLQAIRTLPEIVKPVT
jgi:hypothetical protein